MQRSLARQLDIATGITVCVAAGFAIGVLLTGSLEGTGAKGLGSAFVAGVCVVAGLVGATVLDREDRRRSLGQATIALSAIELVLALLAIWFGLADGALGRALGVSSALLPALAHACLMLGRLRPDDRIAVRRLARAAVGFVTTGAILLAGAFALALLTDDGSLWRLLGVLAVLGVLSTLLALIVRRSDGRPAAGPAVARKAGR